MNIYKSVQKLSVGNSHRQTGDLISLLSFLESKLKSEQLGSYVRGLLLDEIGETTKYLCLVGLTDQTLNFPKTIIKQEFHHSISKHLLVTIITTPSYQLFDSSLLPSVLPGKC
jgi:hypothetical protein